MTLRDRLVDLRCWIHDIPARATFRRRMRRMMQREVLDLVHEFVEHFALLAEIRLELERIREVLDDRLESITIMLGSPRR